MRRKTHELCCFLIGCVFKHVGSVGGNKLSEEESLRLEYYGTEVVDGHSERMKGNSSMNEFTRIFREISFHQTEHNYTQGIPAVATMIMAAATMDPNTHPTAI